MKNEGVRVESFNTIAEEACEEQVIEKSRFIALAAHVTNISEVEKHMQEVKQTYPNARHYVYAYRLYERKIEKSSDDGEPQGTGGRPVLDILQHRQVWDVQIIVVRYFGGILLGTGGLTRAYSRTARLAIDKSVITQLVPNYVYRLQIPYPWYEQIKYTLRQKQWDSNHEQFSEKISFDTYIPATETAEFEKWIDELANGQIQWNKMEVVLREETQK